VRSIYFDEPDLLRLELARLELAEKALVSDNPYLEQKILSRAAVLVVSHIAKYVMGLQSRYTAASRRGGFRDQIEILEHAIQHPDIWGMTFSASSKDALSVLRLTSDYRELRTRLADLLARIAVYENRTEDFRSLVKEMDDLTKHTLSSAPSRFKVTHAGWGGASLSLLYHAFHP